MDYAQQYMPATPFDYDEVASTRDILTAVFESNVDDALDASDVNSVMKDLGFSTLSVSTGLMWMLRRR